jgi:hypothetical protein
LGSLAWIANYLLVLLFMGQATARPGEELDFVGTSYAPQAAPGVIVLVATEIVAVAAGSAWTIPGLKDVPGVEQVFARIWGLACRAEVETKAFRSAPVSLTAKRCFGAQFVLGCE